MYHEHARKTKARLYFNVDWAAGMENSAPDHREIVSETATPDINYYMAEGCGSFAYALWIAYGRPAHGTIGVIASADGEPWSRSIPFEITHVYFEIDDMTIDVRGIRDTDDMVEELYLGGGYNVEGPYPPETLRHEFMGMSDRFPLHGGTKAIKEALGLIRQNLPRYGFASPVNAVIHR